MFNSLTLGLRILRDARDYWGHLALIFVISLFGMLLALLTPVSLKIAIDSVLDKKPLPQFLQTVLPTAWQTGPASILLFACSLTFLVILMQSIQSYGLWIYQRYVGESLVLNFRAKLFRHVQSLSIGYHDKAGTADLLYRLQNDIYNMQQLAVDGLIPLCTSSLTFIIMFYITLQLDWQLALLAIAILPILWVVNRIHASKSRRQWALVKETERGAIGTIQEALNYIRVVKAFSQEDRETAKFRERATTNLRRYIRALWVETAFGWLIAAAIAAASAIALYLAVQHVLSGILTLGNFLVVVTYLAQLFKPLEVFTKQAASTQASLASADRVYTLKDLKLEIDDAPDATALLRTRGEIEFEAVDFQYRPDQPNLRKISFHIEPGSRVAIVGETGAGKTTLMNLLVRFFEPTSGRILLDGQDLRAIKLADLRRQFAMVLQDTMLFSGTILENITYGRPESTQAEVVSAAMAADAHEFILRLPDGYATQVGEKGMALSGGERQRLAIARAFLVDAPILLLDEPTSSVDIQKEMSIVKTLRRLQQGRTTFTISHRQTIIENYDRVLRIEDGMLKDESHRPNAMTFEEMRH